MKIFKLVLLTTIISGLSSLCLKGQESSSPLSKEIWLTGYLFNYNGFGLQYKSQKGSETYLRIGFNNLNAGFNKRNIDETMGGYPTLTTNFSFKFEIGLEKRKAITEKLSAFYGINFIAGSVYVRNKTENPTLPSNLRYLDDYEISPGLGFNSGLMLNLKNAFSLAAEITPELSYSYKTHQRIISMTKAKETYNSGYININNELIRISLIYNWSKKL